MRRIEVLALGADPEVFLVNAKNEPMSAEGLFGGTKREPKPMEGLGNGFFIQEDNVAAEYNIPATESVELWAKHLQKGLGYIRKVAKKHKLKPFLAPSLDFPIEQLMTKQAMELGCDPDFNAWTQQKNPRPRPPEQMRTAAGHVHVSWNNPDDEQRWALVRALDVFLGLPSILVTAPNERRKLYGRAGACRLKPYGAEYRVLDNFYLGDYKLSIKIGSSVYDAAHILNNQPLINKEIIKQGPLIQRAINDHDQKLAAELVDHFNVVVF